MLSGGDHELVDVLRGWPSWLHLLIVVLDIDALKRVNDEFGHRAGDRVLEEVGNHLSTAIPDAPAYRYGGDQFVVLVEGCRTAREARSAAEQVRRTVDRPVELAHGHGVWVTASVGAALALHGQAEQAFERAYSAVHQAKEAGKNCVVLAA